MLAGSFGIGTGDKLDKSKGTVLGVGSFYMLPANTTHYARSGPKGVTLQVHGVGPSGMTMVEPAKKWVARSREEESGLRIYGLSEKRQS